MSRPTHAPTARAEELLAQRATEGLAPAEAAELAALGADQDLGFDLAAAAIDIATLRPEAMPASVADKVLAAAGVRAASAPVPSTLAGVAPPRPLTPSRPPMPADDLARARVQKTRAATYAWIAAAACLVVAAGAVVWATQRPPRVITREVERVVLTPNVPAAEARAQLLASAPDATTLAWTATPDEAARGASGDVVWSPSQQRGYMRFVGLAANDPAQAQYQLWIFDKQRDQAFPVDGGVFDVSASGEVIVPITARLPVGEPVLFAVTVERPGGVVVSKRERIVVTAAPTAG